MNEKTRKKIMKERLVGIAENFATHLHHKQKRKFHNEKYITHPEMVAFIVETLGLREEAIAAAWLHDVVEDCDVNPYWIKKMFGEIVSEYVRVLTKDETEDKEDYVKRFVKCRKEIAIIKLADVYHNSLDLNCYAKEETERKRYLIEKYYLPRAKKDCPFLYKMIKSNLQKSLENDR